MRAPTPPVVDLGEDDDIKALLERNLTEAELLGIAAGVREAAAKLNSALLMAAAAGLMTQVTMGSFDIPTEGGGTAVEVKVRVWVSL